MGTIYDRTFHHNGVYNKHGGVDTMRNLHELFPALWRNKINTTITKIHSWSLISGLSVQYGEGTISNHSFRHAYSLRQGSIADCTMFDRWLNNFGS